MSIETLDEQETLQEGLDVLMKNLPPSKVARLLCLWKAGSGDYTKERRKLFHAKSVDDLFEEMVALEKRGRKR
jgi:hypothetical protein